MKTDLDYDQQSIAAVPADIFVKTCEELSSKLRTIPEDTDIEDGRRRLHRQAGCFCERYAEFC